MKDTLLVNSKVLREGADQIRGKGATKLTNGVMATATQLTAAAKILEDGPRTQITSVSGPISGTVNFDPQELPGFIHGQRQEDERVLVFDVGILPNSTFYITRRGKVTEK